MMPNITRGDRAAGLMMYLAGPGRHNEHTSPHVVAGHDAVTSGLSSSATLSADDALDVANAVDQPRRVFGTRVTMPVKEWSDELQGMIKVSEKDAHVWHCSLSIAPEDGLLSDDTWAAVAQDFVREMGFTSDDADAAACRWVAIRHGVSSGGNDHVHVVVNLVREDGSKARVHNDMARAQQAANTLERRYGLTVLESREQEQGATAGAKPAEMGRAEREGVAVPARDELRRRVRAVAASAGSESDFIKGLQEARVLVRPRYAEGGRDRVVGYSVALVPAITGGQRQSPIWYGAGRLDKTLGLGQMRARWGQDVAGSAETVAAWTTSWKAASVADKIGTPSAPDKTASLLAGLGTKLGPGVDRTSAADAAGIFARASLALEKDKPGPLAAASDALARAAQPSKFSLVDVDRDQRERRALEGAYAVRLMARATGRDSRTGWVAVLRQAERTGRAVASAQRAQGRLQGSLATTRSLDAVLTSVPQLSVRSSDRTDAPRARVTRPDLVRDDGGRET